MEDKKMPFAVFVLKYVENMIKKGGLDEFEALDKSYITCEVRPNGNIQQYLTKFNYQPKEVDALAFYQEYQNYLNSIWE